MNADTLIVVHAYSGDQQQVLNALPVHLAHKRPVLVLSPEDAPVDVTSKGVTCRTGGLRGYFGQQSLDRQRIHLQMLLETSYRYFLLNDADSMCLSAEIPKYLYEGAENTVWANVVREGRPHTSPYPKVALHPPYFLTRESIERMLAVGPIEAHPVTPFIDWMMVAMVAEAGLSYRSYPDGQSFPAWRHGDIPTTTDLGHDYVHENVKLGGRDGGKRMKQFVERGVVMVHSVKHKEVLDRLVLAHEHFVASGSPDDLLPPPVPEYSGISLLVPFREDSSGTRTATWQWLERFYREHLPEAEIVIGADDGMPYSKSSAVNEAASRARGYILVILDADVFVDPDVIREAAAAIEKSPTPKWFVPFTRAYRLNRHASERLQSGDPATAEFFHPAATETEDMIDNPPGFCHVLSRRAFDRVRGMDPRFRGWGHEDSSFMKAVDTLYGSHSRLPGHIVHLWHDRPGAGSSSSRTWEGQTERKRPLGLRYRRATGDRKAMRALVDEGFDGRG